MASGMTHNKALSVGMTYTFLVHFSHWRTPHILSVQKSIYIGVTQRQGAVYCKGSRICSSYTGSHLHTIWGLTLSFRISEKFLHHCQLILYYRLFYSGGSSMRSCLQGRSDTDSKIFGTFSFVCFRRCDELWCVCSSISHSFKVLSTSWAWHCAWECVKLSLDEVGQAWWGWPKSAKIIRGSLENTWRSFEWPWSSVSNYSM